MFSLGEVIDGLQKGRAYQRPLDDGGTEYVTPAGDGEFQHDVAGKAHGGWGGSATLPIDILKNGRWDENGWELSH
ncbi:hypothetical protein GWN26_01815 [Candidatus Saccharibacteria bacterium]|nr:hypothetical protein [Candidatus Saccharibacteria bacterium]NIV03264.1 hypothetical protein [Calditrichia bacterium]NIS37783.1 hypothetical protein [Candidatus Saccharibacteria bacterium]NIV71422.1 hypothetical protein [Calditrichia bacterium]NIV97942.1 hypothetical protein [Candidatus Saccharibacteria bacterium]